MFLVDTSVWIDYLRERETRQVTWLRRILDHAYPFGLTPEIYQEILQGAASEESFERLTSFFGTQTFYVPEDPAATAVEAARLFFRARRRGLTIRSTVDCHIARVALEHDLLLLHADRDFEYLQVIEPDLRIYQGDLSGRLDSVINEPGSAPYDRG